MLSRAKLALTCFLVILLAGTLSPAGPAAGASPAAASLRDHQDPGVRLISSTEAGLTFEVGVPWEDLSIEPVAAGGKDYVRVSLPGWSASTTAGAPALPELAQSIGVPFRAALSVQVQLGPAHTITLPAPALPAATQRVEPQPPAGPEEISTLPAPILVVEEDPAIYAGGAAYPDALAGVASDGVVRQQRVAAIVACPVQYNPATRELTVYESLQITATFTQLPPSAQGARGMAAESAAYEHLLKQKLLNYETARPWRQAPLPGESSSAAPLPTLGEEPIAAVEGIPWAPPEPGWRVKVRNDGLYRLTYAELQAAGLPVDDPDLSPHTFRLYNLGAEVAIHVEGEADGKFDNTDSILFYGQAVASKYTLDNVYWLTCGGATGARMAVRDGTPGGAQTPTYYPAQRHLESNLRYVTLAPGGDDLEHWLWARILASNSSPSSWSTTFTLTAPYMGSYPATLTVEALGYVQYSVEPDHHVQVYLNNVLLGDAWWDGIAWNTSQFAIPYGLLAAGTNTLRVVLPNDTGAGIDQVQVDWAEMDFPNTFRAEGDVLSFGYDTVGNWQFQVDDFGSNQLAVYDVTDPAAVVRIENIGVTGSGPYAALFQDTLAAPARYWATAISAYGTVQAIEQDTASNLRSTTNSADHIVITHKDFIAQATQLRDWRALRGLRAIAVDVQDVYDEFGYGLVGARPIHDFLVYAYGNWVAPAPSFVALLGDGHYDPKDYYGYGQVSYIPPYLAPVDPWIGETAADNRYVTLVGDDTLPDMMLGRLAVNSSAEATAFVNKILAYEQSPGGDWQQQVLAVADNADSAGNFAAMSEALLNDYLPASYVATKVYYGVTHLTIAGARAAIQASINAGALLVNYVGHAGVDLWATEGLLKTTDVPLLQNEAILPVVLSMTCYDGSYHYPSTTFALAEVLTRAEGKGAVASWSPTGLGIVTAQQYLNRGFFEAMFTDPDGSVTLGEATTAGKLDLWATGVGLDLLDTYLLFGDPATKMVVPEAASSADLQLDKTANPDGIVAPGDPLTYTLTFANNGPASATGVILTDPMPSQLIGLEVVDASPWVTLRAGTTFIFDVQDLAAGSSGWVTVRGTVDPEVVLPATIVNRAEITAAEIDLVPCNDSASISTEAIVEPIMHECFVPMICSFCTSLPEKSSHADNVRSGD